MTTNQLYEIMGHMKTLIQQNPDQARQLLNSNPQFVYALLQAQVILGMVNPQVVQQLLQGGSAPVSTQPPPNVVNVPPPNILNIPINLAGMPAVYPPRGATMAPINQPYGQPNYPPAAGPQPTGPISLDQQKLLLQQVLSLTPAQIESLPLAHQQQVRDLQRQLQMQLQGMT